jgi:hypothetical protein
LIARTLPALLHTALRCRLASPALHLAWSRKAQDWATIPRNGGAW